MLTISLAQAKFILSGEHFVVDGTPSVVLPAPCFTTQVSIQDQYETGISANCIFDCEQPDLNARKKEYEAFVVEQVKRAGILLCIDLTGCGLKIVVKTTIPPGQGAGSSSALSQAIIEAMMKHFIADDFHSNYLRWFGTQLENTWHGPVSGIDNAAIACKRILFYQRYHRPEPIKPFCPMFFVVGTTGPRQSINPYQNM